MVGSQYEFHGCWSSGTANRLQIQYYNGYGVQSIGGVLNGNTSGATGWLNSTGLVTADRYNGTEVNVYMNGNENSWQASNAVYGSLGIYNVFLLSLNNNGAAAYFSKDTIGSAYLGGSMTMAKHKKFYDIMQYFNNNVMLGPEIIVNGGFDSSTSWSGWNFGEISSGKGWLLGGNEVTKYNSAIANSLGGNYIKSGSYYKMEFDVSDCSGTGLIDFLEYYTIASIFASPYSWVSQLPVSNGHYVYYLIAVVTTDKFQIYGWTSNGVNLAIDNLSLKEIL
jgi:hypothetical protein